MFTLQALGKLPEPVVFPVSLARPGDRRGPALVLFFGKDEAARLPRILLGLGGIILLALS